MTFSELKIYTQHHQDDYYEVLPTHHALIITEVGFSSKNAVSKALNINPSQFSGIYQCIIAYHNIMEKAHATK